MKVEENVPQEIIQPKEEQKETPQPTDETPVTTDKPAEKIEAPMEVVENVEPVKEPEPIEVIQEEPVVEKEADNLPEALEELVQVEENPGESNAVKDAKDAVEKVLATASLTSIAGAHATQVNASPEDMEFNRIKSTYTNVQGEFVLDNVVASPTMSSMLSSSVVMSSVDYEIIDGTKIFNDGRFEIVQESLVVEPTKTLKDPEHMMTVQPELPSVANPQDVPDIQSSVVEVNNLPESNNDSINVQPTEELNDEMFKSEAPVEHISTTMASSVMPEVKETQETTDPIESSLNQQPEQIQMTDAPAFNSQTHDDTEEDDDEDDDHEQDLEKKKAFVQEQLQKEIDDQEEHTEDLERNKAFVQEKLNQHEEQQQKDHVQEQHVPEQNVPQQHVQDQYVQEQHVQEDQQELTEMTEMPAQEASTESPGFFSGLFANEEPNEPALMGNDDAQESNEAIPSNEPEPMITEAPVLQQEDVDPYSATPSYETADNYIATENYEPSLSYETPSQNDEIKFFEPGQAPEQNQEQYIGKTRQRFFLLLLKTKILVTGYF